MQPRLLYAATGLATAGFHSRMIDLANGYAIVQHRAVSLPREHHCLLTKPQVRNSRDHTASRYSPTPTPLLAGHVWYQCTPDGCVDPRACYLCPAYLPQVSTLSPTFAVVEIMKTNLSHFRSLMLMDCFIYYIAKHCRKPFAALSSSSIRFQRMSVLIVSTPVKVMEMRNSISRIVHYFKCLIN